jgi:hypothetical protein
MLLKEEDRLKTEEGSDELTLVVLPKDMYSMIIWRGSKWAQKRREERKNEDVGKRQ